MPTHADFLAGILERPEDDGPRLVYADWLEEHDQPERAEFIRVQCELPRLEAEHDKIDASWLPCDFEREEKIDALRRRERELFPGDRLYYGTGDYDYLTLQRSDFRRGFVASVECASGDWQHWGPWLVRKQPLERVCFSDKEPRGRFDLTRGGGRSPSQWCWVVDRGAPAEARSTLPDYLLPFFLSQGEWLNVEDQTHLIYTHWLEAVDALSRAALSWARRLVPDGWTAYSFSPL